MLSTPSVIQIPTDRPDVFAFSIVAEVSRDDMAAMAAYMNDQFDALDKVDMLLIFDRYDGSEAGASLGWEAVKSRFRSLSNVRKYVVVGAPDAAASMIEGMGAIIPVKAETYSREEEAAAWRSIGASRQAAA